MRGETISIIGRASDPVELVWPLGNAVRFVMFPPSSLLHSFIPEQSHVQAVSHVGRDAVLPGEQSSFILSPFLVGANYKFSLLQLVH